MGQEVKELALIMADPSSIPGTSFGPQPGVFSKCTARSNPYTMSGVAQLTPHLTLQLKKIKDKRQGQLSGPF